MPAVVKIHDRQPHGEQHKARQHDKGWVFDRLLEQRRPIEQNRESAYQKRGAEQRRNGFRSLHGDPPTKNLI